MNEQEGNLYETETSKEKITIYNTVLFKLKSKKDLNTHRTKISTQRYRALSPSDLSSRHLQKSFGIRSEQPNVPRPQEPSTLTLI